MKMKKTWFSYPLWLFYAVMTGMLLAVYLSAVSIQVWHLNQYMTAALVAVIFGTVGGVWFGGRKIEGYLKERFGADKHLANMWECFLVLGLTAAALLYRFRLLLYSDGVVEAGEWFEMATVKAGTQIPAIAHGASAVYTRFLSMILSFTGNKIIAGVGLQLFLEIAVILVLYFAVRKLTGRIEAVCVMATMTFAQGFCQEMFRLTPEVFYLLLFALGILLIGVCSGRNMLLGWILTGMYIGWMGYLDPAGWVLLLLGAWVCIHKSAMTETGIWKCCQKSVIMFGTALAVMFVLCGVYAFCTGQAIGNVLYVWMKNWMNGSGSGMNFPTGPDSEPLIGILVCFFAALAVVAFWFHKKQKQDGWILVLIVFTVCDMLGVGALQYECFLTAIWGVLAGIGVTSMRMEDADTIGVSETEKISDTMRQSDADTSSKRKVLLQELVVEEITLEDEKPKVQFIENPLPLPKKHVKKEMDFDHAVDENDDFDF